MTRPMGLAVPTYIRPCDGRARTAPGARVTLPVVANSGGIRKSRTSRWRAGVLIGVHLLMLAHIAHWLINGRTISPVEPSEAMYTLNNGYVNAGFIFFGLAILSTLIFGRYFCGWGCHLVAYQDLCGWLLRKIGIRPKPFRSRILVFAPLALAIYMFVWPTVHRLIFRYEAPPLSNHLLTDDFWQTFPGPGIALLTFAVCGLVIIYFLGNKGFCTYACPYGGFFGLADKFAPGRIRVTDDCEHCGHCTAVCTSNVRVHEEVAKFGMVVDPGCMKCMDCVSVCPNDALYFGFAPRAGSSAQGLRTTDRQEKLPITNYQLPADVNVGESAETSLRSLPLASQPGSSSRRRAASLWQDASSLAAPKTRTYDFALWEEMLMVGIGLTALLSFRGLYNRIPLLLAMAMAAITAFLVLKLIRMFRDSNVRLQNLQLTRGRQLTGWGWSFAAGCAALLVFTAHSGVIQWQVQRGNDMFRDLTIGDEVWLPGNIWWDKATPSRRAELDEAIDLLAAVDRWSLAATPAALQNLVWLHLAKGDAAAAEAAMHRLLGVRPDSATYRGLASLHRKVGRWAEAEAAYLGALEFDPRFDRARLELGAMLLQLGRRDDAATQYREGMTLSPHEPRFAVELSRVVAGENRWDEAVSLLEEHRDKNPGNALVLAELGLLKLHRGDAAGVEHLREALRLEPTLTDARYNLAIALLGLAEGGGTESQSHVAEAISHLEKVVSARPDFAEAHYNLAVAIFMSGRPADALAHAREAFRLAPHDAQVQAFMEMLKGAQ